MIARRAYAAEAVNIPCNDELGVHEQQAGFTRCRLRDLAGTRADRYPLMPRFPCFGLYRERVIERAGLVPATHTCAAFFDEAFDEEQTARGFACHEPPTVRDSSPPA